MTKKHSEVVITVIKSYSKL